MKTYIPIILFFFGSYLQLAAQNQCAQSLNNAQLMFSEGHFYSIPEVLQECLKRGFSREQRIQAYHMLTMVYLYTDEHAMAEESYLKLLRLEPEFDVKNDNDYIEIVYLNKKYKTTPIFTLTARGGGNATTPVIINDYDVNQKDIESNEHGFGYWFGPGVDLSINDHFKVGAELLYRYTSFHYKNVLFEGDVVKLMQVQNLISLPISFKYIHRTRNFQPYAYVGLMYDYLLSSTGTFEFEDITEDQGSFSVRSGGVDQTPLRNKVSFNFVGGIGVKKRIGYQYFFAELRFLGGLLNVVNAGNRFLLRDDYLYDFEGLFQFAYIDDDFYLNSYGFSLGFELPFYKPRRISPEKQGFLKRIFN